jgi:hypothetical protein
LGRRRLNMNDVFLLTTAALTFAPNWYVYALSGCIHSI